MTSMTDVAKLRQPEARRVDAGGREDNPLMGVLAGAIGGMLGSWTMVQFNHLIGGSAEDGGSHPHRRQQASPNDTDATIADEPASSQVAGIAGEHLLGRPLSEREKQKTGPLFHYAFGIAAGALYGALAEMRPQAASGVGTGFGAAVWIGADELGLPILGLARDPREYPISRHASAFGSHIVYGVTTELVRRALRRTWTRSTPNDQPPTPRGFSVERP